MVSKKILSLCASFIVILFVASIVGCSSDEAAAVCGNGVKEGTEQCDDGNLVADDGCSATCTIEGSYTYGLSVINYDGVSNPTVEGIQVQALDNETGDPVTGVAIETSAADGSVSFTLTGRDIIAIRVIGGAGLGSPAADYVDSVQWNLRPTDQDKSAYLLKWINIYLGSFYATGDHANHAADGGQKAVFASHVLFAGPNGPTDENFTWEPVGCATVKFFNGSSQDVEETGVHKQYDNLNGTPTGGKLDTPKENGGFAAFTIEPGKTTIKAYDFTSTNELTDPANPNVFNNLLKSDDGNADITIPSSRTYPTGAHPTINLANVYIKAAATNPEAACTD